MSDYGSFTKIHHHAPHSEISPSNPALSVAGKVIVITGGSSSGIGIAIAHAFVEAGAEAIMLIGRTESSLRETQIEISGANTASVSYSIADITDPKAIAAAFSATIKLYGKIDVLVNNAGYLSSLLPLVEAPLDDYWLGFEANVKGPVTTTQAFLKIAQPGSTIINVSTALAVLPALPNMSAYTSSKLATAKIMESVQNENPGLRVFNLQPGVIKTNMAKKSGWVAQQWDEPGIFYC